MVAGIRFAVVAAALLAGCIQVGVPDHPEEAAQDPVEFDEAPDGVAPPEGGGAVLGPGGSGSGSPPPNGACDGPGPPRQVGDWWDYGMEPVPSVFTVEAREIHAGFDTFRINATMNETFSQIDGYSEDPSYTLSWVCAGTGALVARHEHWNRTMGTLVDYDQPCRILRYPLEVGARWTTTCEHRWSHRDRPGGLDVVERYDVHVTGNETWGHPAGPITTMTVLINWTGWQGHDFLVWHVDPSLCAGPVFWQEPWDGRRLSLASWSCKD